MKHIRTSGLLATVGTLVVAGVVLAAPMMPFNMVKPGTYDPVHGFLVQASWLSDPEKHRACRVWPPFKVFSERLRRRWQSWPAFRRAGERYVEMSRSPAT